MSADTSEWLTRLREEMVEISTSAAREFWPGPTAASPPYFNYRLEHIRQVERNAKRLLAQLGGDSDVVLASVWIHDRFQTQFTDSNHAARAAEWSGENLSSYRFPADKVEMVCFTVAHHSDVPGSIPPEAKEARILWDADKLTKLGPSSIVAFLCSNPAFPAVEVTYASVAQSGQEFLKEVEPLIGKFYFEVSREWALERFKVQRTFYDVLAQEVSTL